MNLPHILHLPCVFAVAALGIFAQAPQTARAVTLESSAVAWWTLETDTSGTNGKNLVPVSTTTSGLTPVVSASFASASGIAASNAGSSAMQFDGSTVLKTSDPSFRIGGAQTFWMRVNFSSVTGTFALMDRSRAVNSQRGISLQMFNGRLQAYASSDGQTYEAQLGSSTSYLLSAGTWYDISLRYEPSVSLTVDLYDPGTGMLLDSITTTTNIPASISTSNSIGSGYFQLGGINNGSAGSAWVFPSGTLVEAAGVWNTALSNADLASLSAIPEPSRAASLAGAMMLMGAMVRRRARSV